MPETTREGLLLWGGALLLASGALLQVLSALLDRSGPIRLRHWVVEAGGSLEALYGAPRHFEAFRVVLSVLARLLPLLSCLLLGAGLGRLLPPPAALLLAVVCVVVVVAAVEVVGRTLVGRDPEKALRRWTTVIRITRWLLLPLQVLVLPVLPASALKRREDEEEDEASEEEIEAFIKVGAREGILEPEDEDLLWGVVDFGGTQVKSVMTPRIDMVCAPLESDLETLASLFLESRHSRLPIFEGSIDHIVGILHIRDLLRALRGPEPPALADLVSRASFVPEAKLLDDLLREMQAQHLQMAIVVDEYGGTAGLVTVEDLVEEIVGEISDEHEPPQVGNVALDGGRWRLSGQAHLEMLDELFDVAMEEAPYETVGGLILSELGYVPKAGKTLDAHGLRFTVERVEGRRIRSVLVEPVAVQAAEEPPA